MDGVNAARLSIPKCWFDREKCRDGLEALRQYRADYDEKQRTFKDAPRHDWSSHSADAFRYMCMAWREMAPPSEKKHEPLRGFGQMTVDEMLSMTKPQRFRV